MVQQRGEKCWKGHEKVVLVHLQRDLMHPRVFDCGALTVREFEVARRSWAVVASSEKLVVR